LSLASDIFLKEASIFDISKRTTSALDEDLAAIKRELLAFKEVSVIQLLCQKQCHK